MNKTALLIWHTWADNLTRPGYLLFTFGMPLFLFGLPLIFGGLLFLAIQSALPPTSPLPIGVVDETGDFSDPARFYNRPVAMYLYASDADAQAALANGEIQAWYRITASYWQDGRVILTYDVAPSEAVREMFLAWLRSELQSQVPDAVMARYLDGASITHRELDGERVFTGDNFIEWVLVYFVIYFARLGGSYTAGYMYDTIASEAKDRTIEILLSSLTALQFVVGKLVGLLLVGLTQLAVWSVGVVLLAVGVATATEIDPFVFLLTWPPLPYVALLVAGAFVLDQTAAASAGMMRVSGGAGPQLFNLMNWAFGVGLVYAAYFVPRSPDSVLAVLASLFPLTAPIVMPIRLVASTVPLWQTVLAQALLWATVVASVLGLRWLLRANLVSYAERFSIVAWVRARVLTMMEPRHG